MQTRPRVSRVGHIREGRLGAGRWYKRILSSLAGIFNSAGHFYGSTGDELTAIYKENGIPAEYKKWFRDITQGRNAYPCVKGWDFCSGVGTPLTFKGK